MLTRSDLGKLANLYHSDAYRVLVELATVMIERWRNAPGNTDTEFKFFLDAVKKDSKPEALGEFLKEIEKLSTSKPS